MLQVAIYDVLKEMSQLHASKKKRYTGKDAELLKKVSTKTITKETPSEKLAQHVEQVTSFKACYFIPFKIYKSLSFFWARSAICRSQITWLNNFIH